MASTVDFLMTPDFSKITSKTLLTALGQAFYSIGIAMAVMIIAFGAGSWSRSHIYTSGLAFWSASATSCRR